MLIQQGDVLLKKIKTLPPDVQSVQPDARGFVLAEGEATGHHHTLEAQETTQLYTLDEILYLVVEAEASLTHQEHDTIQVPPGIYEIGRVREYDYMANEARTVRD
jgi:hypothetical protein